MATRQLPSLEIILDEARSERQAQLIHFEALDAKAGVVLGFAAAIVALSPDRTGAFATTGRAFAVLSGLAALASFWPRRFWLTDLRTLREKYLTAEAPFTRLNILDAAVAESMQVRSVLIQKARLLKASMVSLAAAVLCIATALTYTWDH